MTGMRRIAFLTAGAVIGGCLGVAPRLVAQNQASPASTAPDSLEISFAQQARSRFQQAGAEVTQTSWFLLGQSIRRGAVRLREDGPTTGRIAQARQNLNIVVDWMIEAADTTVGGRVVGEGSYAAAMRKCPPPKYPFCP